MTDSEEARRNAAATGGYDEFADWRQAVANCTPGPWYPVGDSATIAAVNGQEITNIGRITRPGDREFITLARTAVPYLLRTVARHIRTIQHQRDKIKELTAELATLRQAAAGSIPSPVAPEYYIPRDEPVEDGGARGPQDFNPTTVDVGGFDPRTVGDDEAPRGDWVDPPTPGTPSR